MKIFIGEYSQATAFAFVPAYLCSYVLWSGIISVAFDLCSSQIRKSLVYSLYYIHDFVDVHIFSPQTSLKP
jgi:hypothetical protein